LIGYISYYLLHFHSVKDEIDDSVFYSPGSNIYNKITAAFELFDMIKEETNKKKERKEWIEKARNIWYILEERERLQYELQNLKYSYYSDNTYYSNLELIDKIHYTLSNYKIPEDTINIFNDLYNIIKDSKRARHKNNNLEGNQLKKLNDKKKFIEAYFLLYP